MANLDAASPRVTDIGACLLIMVINVPPILRKFDSQVILVLTLTPATLIFAYVANLLLFTDEVGNLTAGYPRRTFSLPVSTRTLVLWPMLIAVGAVVALWLIISVLIYERGGYQPPLRLPAIALAVIVAWNQTACWMPIKSQLVRVNSITIGLTLLLGAPLWLLIQGRVSSSVLTAIGLTEFPVMFALALLGLTHARRGDEWSLGLQDLPDRFWAALNRLTKLPSKFSSAAQAQLWYEKRCHAWLLTGCTYINIL
jgi:hypothetical protein